MELHEKDFAGSYDREDDCQVLIKKAEMFELMELQKITVNREQLLVLEKLLNDAYIIRRPKPSEYEYRKQVIQVLNDIAKDLYGNDASCPVVEEYGSFLMDLFATESDLDLSINFRNSLLVFPRDQKIKTLRKFAKKLYKLQRAGGVQKVEPIMGAKVPILKFVDTATLVECDISVENRDGISKSLIIRLLTSIDERFQKLSFLMKAWAKAHDINSPKERTLNSVSIILLVAFHLQTRDPPILPPFSAILQDGEDPASLEKSVRNFQNYGTKNTETLGELFVSFLIKLASVEDLWPKGLCASPYLGHWTYKTWDNKIAIMSIEDFVDRTQNVGRTVGQLEVKKIYECIHLTIENLGLFMGVKLEELKLKESFFGIDGMHHPRVEKNLNVTKDKYKKNHLMTKTSKLTIDSVSNPDEPELNVRKGRYKPKHRKTKNPKLTINKPSNTVEPKLNAKYEKDHLVTETSKLSINEVSSFVTENPGLTMNNVSNRNGVMDQRGAPNRSTMPLPTGHWGVPQQQAVTAGLETPWAHQWVYNQPMMGMRVGEGATTAQMWGPGWGGPGWTHGWGGGASSGSWFGANGTAYNNDHLYWSQEMQPATDPWGRRLQQHYYGNSSIEYGPPFR